MISREFVNDARAVSPQRLRMAPSQNELGWIEFIRLISDDEDPAPNLRCIQALRFALDGGPLRMAGPFPLEVDFGNKGDLLRSPPSAASAANALVRTASKAAAGQTLKARSDIDMGGDLHD